MQITLTGRHVELGDALDSYARERLNTTVTEYRCSAIETHGALSRDGSLVDADTAIHAWGGINRQSHAKADGGAAAFDLTANWLGKRLRRHKRRLRDHHRDERGAAVD